MSKTALVTIIVVIGTAAIVALSLPLALAKAQVGHGDHGRMHEMGMAKDAKTPALTLEKVHSGHLPMVSMSIEKALMAVERGDKKTALAELNKAKKMIAEINAAIGRLVKPKFANVRCPIMGSPINPDKVTKDLIREYKGEKIAFCCAGCPAVWDRFSDTAKAGKLAKVKATFQKVWTCSMHPQIRLPKQGLCPICNMRLIAASTQSPAGRKH